MFESLSTEQRLVHELTQLDERKRARDRHWNPYFLGIAFQSLEGFDADVSAGMSAEQAFADRFTPCREMHGVARRLGLAVDVDRGRWVLPDGEVV